MKIVFFTPTLQIGGYERVIVTYANYIAEMLNEEVTIICGNSNGDLKKEISQVVMVIDLQCRTKMLLFKSIFEKISQIYFIRDFVFIILLQF